MEFFSREDARAQGLTRYFTGEPCKFGHVSSRSARDTKCVACTLQRQNEKRAQIRAEQFPEGRDPWKKCADGEKVCRKCREAKAVDLFSPDTRATDGLQPQCRKCQTSQTKAKRDSDIEAANAKRRAYYAKNKAMFATWSKGYRERHSDQIKVDKKAYYDRVKLDPEWQLQQKELREVNKGRKSRYDVTYRERNPGKCNARAKEWRRKNPEKRSAIMKSYSARRRANCADGDSTAAIYEWEKAAVKVCYWCGKKCAKDYHVDHYEPLARGGRHVITNLVIACPPCNRKKNAKDPFDFAASLGRLF